MKNKKLILLSGLLGLGIIVLTQSSLSFASSSVWGDISEYKKMVTEEMKDKMEKYRETVKTQLQTSLKTANEQIKSEIFDDLDDDTLEQLKALQEEYKEKKEKLKDLYQNSQDISLLKEAMKSLLEEKIQKIEDVLPEDKVELYQELKDELEQKREEQQIEKQTKKAELIQERFSKTTQMIIGKLDTSFKKFEKKQNFDTEKINIFYARFTSIVELSIKKVENNENMSDDDKLERIDILEGILFSIEERRTALLADDSDIEDELNDIIDSIVE